ncbi:MEKHLA domain-containing protein [Leptolyngbya sp. BL0902]|uniref:MEKHLA domain-containing protein n=1 Tax=Leptolyngbya sp. BL0902 TaxID=1115757 RepID=UPI0018E7A193|nr:MEKHLA domain-containing protein [Leptolyngbya sp. BL0902]QQE64800.1 MEKHLA domain-containing protein [Leptolyngbya sp. BL0902]
MVQNAAPSPQNRYLADHVDRLRYSFRRLLGEDLIDPTLSDVAAAQALYEAPFVVVSHGTEADPIFNYANRMAQQLFELSWEDFTALPSRLSAELPNRAERAQLLATVAQQGFIRDYAGVRIAKSGRRFTIQNAIVWNVSDGAGTPCGQAALFHQWQSLEDDDEPGRMR